VIGLNWMRGSAAGALTSMLVGLVTCVWWSLLRHPPFGLDAVFPGVAASIAVFIAVSVFGQPGPAEAGHYRRATSG